MDGVEGGSASRECLDVRRSDAIADPPILIPACRPLGPPRPLPKQGSSPAILVLRPSATSTSPSSRTVTDALLHSSSYPPHRSRSPRPRAHRPPQSTRHRHTDRLSTCTTPPASAPAFSSRQTTLRTIPTRSMGPFWYARTQMDPHAPGLLLVVRPILYPPLLVQYSALESSPLGEYKIFKRSHSRLRHSSFSRNSCKPRICPP